MRKYHIPQPQKIRKIERSFAWIDHRLMRNGFVAVMTHRDLALYMFLILAAEVRHNINETFANSIYSKRTYGA